MMRARWIASHPDPPIMLARPRKRGAEDRLQGGGRLVRLADIASKPRALELAAPTSKDARLAEVVLCESSEILRSRPDMLIDKRRAERRATTPSALLSPQINYTKVPG
jgi:hypothetical protein